MKKLFFLASMISSAAFAQQKNDILSPKEKERVQNKIETPVFLKDKKTEPKTESKAVTKDVEIKSGSVVPEKKIVIKKKRKRIAKKSV